MTPSPVDSAPRLLHLGCGLCAPAEWYNMDGSWGAWFAQHPTLRKFLQTIRLLPGRISSVPWPSNIHVRDFRKPLPFADGSIDACYSSHLIEHLFRDDALVLLAEIRRVLKPGGICRTLVPDLRSIVREYNGELDLGGSAPNGKSITADDAARRMCARLHFRLENPPRGSKQKFYSGFGDFQTHKWMYDAPSLVKLMEEAGFVQCQPRDLHQSAIPFIDKVEMPDRVQNGAGVIAEGIKSAS